MEGIRRFGLKDVDEDAHARYQKVRVDPQTGDWRTFIFQDQIEDDLILTTQDKNIALYDKSCKECFVPKLDIKFEVRATKYPHEVKLLMPSEDTKSE